MIGFNTAFNFHITIYEQLHSNNCLCYSKLCTTISYLKIVATLITQERNGRMFDLRLKVLWFKTHRRHFVLCLSKHFILCFVLVQPRKTGIGPKMTEKLLTRTVNHQHKHTYLYKSNAAIGKTKTRAYTFD